LPLDGDKPDSSQSLPAKLAGGFRMQLESERRDNFENGIEARNTLT